MAKPQRLRRRAARVPAAALRALRESETRYRVLAEQSRLGIVIHKDFIIRYANPALVTLFGYGRTGEVIGRDLRGVLAPSDRPRAGRYVTGRRQGEPPPSRYRCQAGR